MLGSSKLQSMPDPIPPKSSDIDLAAQGAIVREVKMSDTYPTNICFGGADMKTAYITLSDKGQLGVMQWPTAGLKLNYN